MRGRTVFFVVSVFGGAWAWGCSSSNTGTPSSGGGGGGSADAGPITYVTTGACNGRNILCLPLLCTCNDGTTEQTQWECSGGQCVDETSSCTQLCGDAGVASVGPADTLIGSPECNAFCAKLSAACPSSSCDPLFDCDVRPGSCDASERAYLQCETDNGTFACQKNGYVFTSNCNEDTSVCGGDGG